MKYLESNLSEILHAQMALCKLRLKSKYYVLRSAKGSKFSDRHHRVDIFVYMFAKNPHFNLT
jgi:hypothetical protein